jgi:hypothetical protein
VMEEQGAYQSAPNNSIQLGITNAPSGPQQASAVRDSESHRKLSRMIKC